MTADARALPLLLPAVCETSRRAALSVVQKRYAVLYIDPPWEFEVWGGTIGSRSAESHYSVLTSVDIRKLPMPHLMADDCTVFMWTTWTHLPIALDLGIAWGLEYKTCAFNWCKLNKSQSDTPFMGMGYWTRANSEPCLLFTKGKPRRKSKGVPQMLIDWQGGLFETETVATRIGRHSEKPTAFYERIEALVEGPYAEIFARKKRAGWDSYGNEIDGRDIRDVLGSTYKDNPLRDTPLRIQEMLVSQEKEIV